MNKFLRFLIVFGFFFAFGYLAGGPKAEGQGAKVNGGTKGGSVQPATTATISKVDSGPMPFSNEEANFYRRAWPIDKSHSIWALVLYGSVVVILATLIIRQMAKSSPRKPPAE